jgi:hypothetical protein
MLNFSNRMMNTTSSMFALMPTGGNQSLDITPFSTAKSEPLILLSLMLIQEILSLSSASTPLQNTMQSQPQGQNFQSADMRAMMPGSNLPFFTGNTPLIGTGQQPGSLFLQQPMPFQQQSNLDSIPMMSNAMPDLSNSSNLPTPQRNFYNFNNPIFYQGGQNGFAYPGSLPSQPLPPQIPATFSYQPKPSPQPIDQNVTNTPAKDYSPQTTTSIPSTYQASLDPYALAADSTPTPSTYQPPVDDPYTPVANPSPAPAPAPTPSTYQPPVDDPYTPVANPSPTPAPAPTPPAYQTPANDPYAPAPVFSNTPGAYEGDPHLTGFDGEKYDVMGQSGKIYNMLSDKNFQYNTAFMALGPTGNTAIGNAGILVGIDQLGFDAKVGIPTLNGTALAVNKKATLADGTSTALWDGTTFTVDSPEYEVALKLQKEFGTQNLQSTIKLLGSPFADDVKPHGLLGQTADGVAGNKDTGTDQGNQGGTVIDGSINDYEVNSLFDTSFKNFNRFSGMSS